MFKLIRILSFVSVGLVATSLCLLVFSYPLQQPIVRLFDYPHFLIEFLPILPLKEIASVCLRLACVALLPVCAFWKKGGIWLEIVLFACLLMLPAVDDVCSYAYTLLLRRTQGDFYYTAYTATASISAFCLHPSSWGTALAYAVCGMSLATKRLAKKAKKAEKEAAATL